MVYFFFSESYRYGNYRVGMIWVTITLKYLYIRSSQVTVSFLFYWIIVNLQPGISFNCKSDSYICIYQFSSVAQLCTTLCDPMNRSTPGLPVHHKLPEFTQTHVHWVCDAIQPSHLLLSHSPPAPNPSQHQGLFQWVNSLHEVAKVLEFQLQHQSFQWTPRTDLHM